ncbi:MAG: mechanosensitive ion channel family protein [Halovenus sp.]
MVLESLLSETYFGSTVPQYLLFFVILSIGAILGKSLRFLYKRRLNKKVEATETEIDDVIVYTLGRPVTLLAVVLSLFVARRVLTPVEPFRSVLEASVQIPVIVLLAWIAVRLTDGLIETYVVEYTDQTESKLDDELVPIISRMTNIAIVSISGIVILDSVGYDVTAVIASLGIGGVAVAFASRKTMADIFGGAHILAAKPFLVDDVVEIDGTAGTVEEIGLRTTRLRGFDGRAITLPNSTVAAAEVTNITSEPTRRIKTFLGLSYETSPEEMERALELLAETVNAVDGVDPEQTGAWFWEYGDSAIEIRLDYYIEARDRWKAVKDTVNRNIQQAFEDEGFDMAFPTRTLRLEGDGTELDRVAPEEQIERP